MPRSTASRRGSRSPARAWQPCCSSISPTTASPRFGFWPIRTNSASLARSCHIRSACPVLNCVTRVLVIGGTGTLGSVVVDRLLSTGADVRVLSRGRRRRRSDVEHLIGDARSGDGLERTFADVDLIVLCAEHARQVAAAARRAGTGHLVYTSIVGIDRIPFFFYRRKLGDERLIAASGVPWTVLRANAVSRFDRRDPPDACQVPSDGAAGALQVSARRCAGRGCTAG